MLLSVVAVVAGAQSPTQDQSTAQETQVRGYWVDPSTGLMWAGKDNGKDVNLRLATKYCRDLRLAGYSDWRLAMIDQLQGISDKNVDAPGKAGYGRLRNVTWHIKGDLFLTGVAWSSNLRDDAQGYAWGFDFYNGIRWEEDTSFYTGRRALCVRSSNVVPPPQSTVATVVGAQSSTRDRGLVQETQSRGFWTDPSTGLMWAGRDNGKDVSWKGAVKYCRNLRLAGYSDWRLATIAELGTIYDRNANVPGLFGSGKDNLFTWHVKGNLFLTGDEWSGEQGIDDRGHPDGYALYFDFNEGQSRDDPTGWPYSFANSRALCVRGSGK